MVNKITVLAPLNISSVPLRAVAGVVEEKQPDLLYMDSVLVSTGENKNDDFFLPEEMWAARRSPILKPVDWEHNTGSELLASPSDKLDDNKKIVKDNQIIGAMYDSYAADKDGVVLAEDATPPKHFDIINKAVIYKYLFPNAAEKITSEAKAGKLFVSMEAWFKKYDYKLGTKIVARNEETAFLDKHLRACGGDGYFEGQKISRVLRNICFGGIGIVANPANSDSIIKSVAQESGGEINSALASHVIANLEEKIMADVETKIEVKAEELNKQTLADLVKAEISRDSAIADLEKAKAEIASLTEANSALSSSLKLAQESEAAVVAKFTALDAKVKAMELDARNASRAQVIEKLLAEFILDAEAATARKGKMVKASESMDDAAFAAFLDDVRDLLTVAKKGFVPFGKKKDEDEKDDMKSECAQASAKDEGIVDTAVLDTVKATASAPAGKEEVAPPMSLVDRMRPLANELLSSTKKA